MRSDTLDYAEMEDAVLAELFRARDSGAVRFITARNNQRLFRAAWAVLKDNGEAEDAVQSGYLKAFAAIDSFEGRSKLSTWLTRIVINEALTRRRTARRRAPPLSGKLTRWELSLGVPMMRAIRRANRPRNSMSPTCNYNKHLNKR